MVRWLPLAAADVPSGSRHGVSRVRRVRGHPTARAPHARMSRRPRHARTRQRAHSPTHLHDNAQARHKHISAHCASLTPPTAALLGAGGHGHAGDHRALDEAPERPGRMDFHSNSMASRRHDQQVQLCCCRSRGHRPSSRAARGGFLVHRWLRVPARRPRARTRAARERAQAASCAWHACMCVLSVCVFTGARHVRADANFR